LGLEQLEAQGCVTPVVVPNKIGPRANGDRTSAVNDLGALPRKVAGLTGVAIGDLEEASPGFVPKKKLLGLFPVGGVVGRGVVVIADRWEASPVTGLSIVAGPVRRRLFFGDSMCPAIVGDR